jgi:hypothetical protein
MPARAAAAKQAVTLEVVKPAPQLEEDDDLAAALSEAYKPAAEVKAAEPQNERTTILAIGQFVVKLKESVRSGALKKQSDKEVKNIEVFVFTDDRTMLRSETSKAGKAYQRYIVQPLIVNCIFTDGCNQMIQRSELAKVFGPYYLSLFYSQYGKFNPDLKLNRACIDAAPQVRGDYVNYGYDWKPVDPKLQSGINLAAKFANLKPPVVQAYKPKRYSDFDYTNTQ